MRREGAIKHWDVICKWKDGAEIQYKSHGKWVDLTGGSPIFGANDEYRVKPVVVRYRVFLWRTYSGKPCTLTVSESAQHVEDRARWQGFIRWLGDWQEVEV